MLKGKKEKRRDQLKCWSNIEEIVVTVATTLTPQVPQVGGDIVIVIVPVLYYYRIYIVTISVWLLLSDTCSCLCDSLPLTPYIICNAVVCYFHRVEKRFHIPLMSIDNRVHNTILYSSECLYGYNKRHGYKKLIKKYIVDIALQYTQFCCLILDFN